MIHGIPAEKYYFLLEWKDTNMNDYIAMKGECRLCDLTTYELNKLHESILVDINYNKDKNERVFRRK